MDTGEDISTKIPLAQASLKLTLDDRHCAHGTICCKELLPAPGNRSNKRRDREEDLATREEERSERGRRE
ncbi:hypothetical protein TNCV_695741 [Trichonephila clavipes]|nr:hypothetical protein TNCV_695741 [Trichonephila clavipes]